MNIDQANIIHNCRTMTAYQIGMANSMKRIGDLQAMDEYIERAMDWATHTDLICHIVLNTELQHA